jgi:hypothetical protein
MCRVTYSENIVMLRQVRDHFFRNGSFMDIPRALEKIAFQGPPLC